MTEEFQIERHTKLWEDKTKHVKRIVFSGLLFGGVILVNVLTPYSEDIGARAKLQQEIDLLRSQAKEVEASLAPLDDLTEELAQVKATITAKPWNARIENLKQRYRHINAQGGADWDTYQREADATVDSVAAQVKKSVLTPLARFTTDSIAAQAEISDLAQQMAALPGALDSWVNKNMGRRWYRTIESKEAEINDLTYDLNRRLRSFDNAVNGAIQDLQRKKRDLRKQIERLQNSPAIRDKEKKLAALRAEMEKILPEWIKGMVSVEQMVQLFPFIVVLLAGYALFTGKSVASHYHFLAKKLGFASAGREDASYSSIWTFTWRGAKGTLLTVGTYSFFILVMWLFYEVGVGVLQKWLEAESSPIISEGGFVSLIWLFRIAIAGILVYTASWPYRQKNVFQS